MHKTKSLLLSLALIPAGLFADVKLPAVISDHMVLQQDMPVRIWGQADPGEAVSLTFQGQKISGKADAAGKWALFLMPMKAGGPADLTISGRNSITVHDVLVGEVWIGSGQSNMELPMTRVNNAEQEIAAANFPTIRLFTVKKKVSDTPLDDVEGSWQLCSPETVAHFSAVGYFFSRELHSEAASADRVHPHLVGRHAGAVVDQPRGAGSGAGAEVHPGRLEEDAGQLSGRAAEIRRSARALETGGRSGAGRQETARPRRPVRRPVPAIRTRPRVFTMP